MCLDVGGDPAVRQSLESNDARSSTSFVPTGRAIPVLSVPTRPSRVVLCRQNSRYRLKYSREKNLSPGKSNLPRQGEITSTRARV